MSEPKFTPGPWLPHIAFNDPEGFPEFCVDVMKAATRDDYKLIAAAPELYEALVDMHRTQLNNNKHDPDDYENTEQFLRVTAALAKARGESHD